MQVGCQGMQVGRVEVVKVTLEEILSFATKKSITASPK